MVARDLGRVLFVVGAGASYPAPSNLPGFRGLVQEIFAQLDTTMIEPMKAVSPPTSIPWDKVVAPLNDFQRTELKFFAEGEYDVALGMLERRIDTDLTKRSSMRKAAAEVLARTKLYNRLHGALVELGQRYGQTLLVTTNFDRLLSTAAKASKLSGRAYALGQIPNPSVSAEFAGILHIHGILGEGREPESRLILTDQDFGDAYLRRHATTEFLYDAARIFNIVLVGYSANDSPVRYLLNAIAADERHHVDLKARYAFVGATSGDTRIAAEWEARGIRPIVYDKSDDHKALGDLLVRWSALLPGAKNAKNLAAHIADIAASDAKSAVGKTQESVLRYLFDRSNQTERVELVRGLSAAGAAPGWLDTLNEMARKPAKERFK
jgi:hypothetical protein